MRGVRKPQDSLAREIRELRRAVSKTNGLLRRLARQEAQAGEEAEKNAAAPAGPVRDSVPLFTAQAGGPNYALTPEQRVFYLEGEIDVLRKQVRQLICSGAEECTHRARTEKSDPAPGTARRSVERGWAWPSGWDI